LLQLLTSIGAAVLPPAAAETSAADMHPPQATATADASCSGSAAVASLAPAAGATAAAHMGSPVRTGVRPIRLQAKLQQERISTSSLQQHGSADPIYWPSASDNVLICSPVSARHPSTTATASGLLAELSGPAVTSPRATFAARRQPTQQQLPLLASASSGAALFSGMLEPAGAAVAGSMLAPAEEPGTLNKGTRGRKPASMAGVLNSILVSAAGQPNGTRLSLQELQGPLASQIGAQAPSARPLQQQQQSAQQGGRVQQHSADPANTVSLGSSSGTHSSPPVPLCNLTDAAAGPPAASADMAAGSGSGSSSIRGVGPGAGSSASGAMVDAEPPLASLSIRDLRDLLGQVAGMSLAQLQGR
jgi:hypothetical protein